MNKSPDQWQPCEVAEWIRNWALHNEVQDIEVAHLLYNQMSGSELCQMQREYFTTVCPQYGNMIFDSLQNLMVQFRSTSANYMTYHPSSNMANTNNVMNNSNPNLHDPNQHAGNANLNNSILQHTLPDTNLHPMTDFFPHMTTIDSLPNVTFDAQNIQHNYSPSYTSGMLMT